MKFTTLQQIKKKQNKTIVNQLLLEMIQIRKYFPGSSGFNSSC